MATGRPTKNFDTKAFQDLVGLGCSQEEICWFFRDETGKPANIDTLTRWCKRTFGMTFQEYFSQNGCMALKIKLRRNQFKLSEKSAAMAIFLGKNYLGQTDKTEIEDTTAYDKLDEILKGIKENAEKAIDK
jgi:methylphosphotriester-DNA--protein-cysteine methyltransferase